jgi:hypothetical protein
LSYDTNQCFEECPEGYMQYDEPAVCTSPCEHTQYVRSSDRVCDDCALRIPGCDQCSYNSQGFLQCDEC